MYSSHPLVFPRTEVKTNVFALLLIMLKKEDEYFILLNRFTHKAFTSLHNTTSASCPLIEFTGLLGEANSQIFRFLPNQISKPLLWFCVWDRSYVRHVSSHPGSRELVLWTSFGSTSNLPLSWHTHTLSAIEKRSHALWCIDLYRAWITVFAS